MNVGSRFKAPAQKPWLTTITGSPAGPSSCSVKVRPVLGETPSVANMLAETHSSLRRVAPPAPVRSETTSNSRRGNQRIDAAGPGPKLRLGEIRREASRRLPPDGYQPFGSLKGNCSSTAFTTVNIAVFAPTPSAIEHGRGRRQRVLPHEAEAVGRVPRQDLARARAARRWRSRAASATRAGTARGRPPVAASARSSRKTSDMSSPKSPRNSDGNRRKNNR